MKRYLLILSVFLGACSPQQKQAEGPQHCQINPGKYDVQTATFLRSAQKYELFVLGAQSCVKQPLEIGNLQLAQLNSEGDAKEAKVEIRGDSNILYMSKSFTIDLVNETVGADGQVMREQSMWAPFLAGAAGAMAGQMIGNAFFNKPRYYQPPVMQPGQSSATGIGGYGSTPQEAKSSYQNTLSKSNLSPQPGSQLSQNPKALPAAKEKPANSNQARKGLFKSRTGKKSFRMKRRR
ncbi:hypothetical protein [Pseudobacteriovorax antillogorgiicola]|uniref:Lipoprotein n=1 Tax=Pseudobacteriovorax antillogorgiicola TaxID=1513793 RepID=A0A1Y6C0M7_9BACT|nr:hypothetical protein [Pseudobacteriovorax antillogorgiicola]TCS52309.1 hypothetical protein EDD56_10953 [Pseudobacteriovorax antillogorgiicola]SMF30274.1 hypothetical protein SAMN06296036_109160 [Pseudobacteriovorax antillogorgiicola]